MKKEMDKKVKVYSIILGMFILTLLIGLFVISIDPLHVSEIVNGSVVESMNPDFMFIESPDIEDAGGAAAMIFNLIFAFIIAIVLILVLNKIKADFFLRGWFFIVATFALFLSLYAFQKFFFDFQNFWRIIIPLGIALVFGIWKIFKRNMLVHNLTELFIYPGIALIFVPLLNIYSLVVILILISAYDMWAVWHTGIMQKMASYQIESVGVFGGFLVPYASRKVKEKIKALRLKYKDKKVIPANVIKKNKLNVNIAVLGGGDIVFSVISMGVVYRILGLIPSLLVLLGATSALIYLFFESKKKKNESYPAMPFVTTGIFVSIILGILWKLAFG